MWAVLSHKPLSRLFAGVLTLLLVSMAGWGWVDRTALWDGLSRDNFIGLVITALGSSAQLGTNLMAIHWRSAHKARGWASWDTCACFVFMIACGLFTHAGLENAWLLTQDRFGGLEAAQIGTLVPILLFAAPWLEPFLYWRLEQEWDAHVETAKRASQEEHERHIAETRELTRLSEARMGRAAREMAHEMARETFDGMTQPFGPAGRPETAPIVRSLHTPSEAGAPARERRKPTKWPPEKKAEVIALRAQKISYRKVEEQTGVPRESARRIEQEFETVREAA